MGSKVILRYLDMIDHENPMVKSSQSNFDLRLPDRYLVRSYLKLLLSFVFTSVIGFKIPTNSICFVGPTMTINVSEKDLKSVLKTTPPIRISH